MKSRPPPPRRSVSYQFLAGAGFLVYVAVAVVQQGGSVAIAAGALLLAQIGLVWIWKRTGQPDVGEHALPKAALRALRVAVWGAGLWGVAHCAGPDLPAFELAKALGLGAAAIASNLALARIPSSEGLARPIRRHLAFDSAAVGAVLWAGIALQPACRALGYELWLFHGLAFETYAIVVGSIASLLLLSATCLRLQRARSLEMGVADRVGSALTLALTALVGSIGLALARVASASFAFPVGLVAATLGCCWVVSLRDAKLMSGGLRGVVALTLVGAPLVVIVAAFTQSFSSFAGMTSVVGGVLAIGVGLFSHRLSAPLKSDQARWLGGLDWASQAALEPEPTAAIDATLLALQRLEQTGQTRPELWRRDPKEVIAVDVAGYLHRSFSDMPQEAYALARDEPEGVLRRSVLRSVSVQHPEVRSSLAWLEARDACVAVLVRQEEEDYGLLVLPQGTRTSELSWEEARACRRLAGRLASVLAVSSALMRAQQREVQAVAELAEMKRRFVALQEETNSRLEAQSNLPQWLARPAQVCLFSARAREASERALGLAKSAGHIVLEASVGGGAVSWAAWIHLQSEDSRGPLVVVDGTVAGSSLEDSECAAAEATRLLLQAQSGTLVLLQVQAMPEHDQVQWVKTLAQLAASNASPPRCILICSTTHCADTMGLNSPLAKYLKPDILRLPTLLERPEDIRGLVLEQLCRSGARELNSALGCELRAMSELVEYSWPGNEQELQSVVEQAAYRAKGPKVTLEDLASFAQKPRPQSDSGQPDRAPVAQPRRGPASRPASAPQDTIITSSSWPAEEAKPRRRRRR